MTTKRKAGRPAYEPNDKDRKFVLSMVAAGIDQEQIAQVLGITKPTLAKHFRTEIDTGTAMMLAEVTESLVSMATGRRGPPNVTAAIFIMKARGGWQDQPQAEKLGKKEQQEQEAKEVATRGKFKRRQPPKLKAVE